MASFITKIVDITTKKHYLSVEGCLPYQFGEDRDLYHFQSIHTNESTNGKNVWNRSYLRPMVRNRRHPVRYKETC